jgi:hypothetical protein
VDIDSIPRSQKKVYPVANLFCFGAKQLLGKAKRKVRELIDPSLPSFGVRARNKMEKKEKLLKFLLKARTKRMLVEGEKLSQFLKIQNN